MIPCYFTLEELVLIREFVMVPISDDGDRNLAAQIIRNIEDKIKHELELMEDK